MNALFMNVFMKTIGFMESVTGMFSSTKVVLTKDSRALRSALEYVVPTKEYFMLLCVQTESV